MTIDTLVEQAASIRITGIAIMPPAWEADRTHRRPILQGPSGKPRDLILVDIVGNVATGGSQRVWHLNCA